MRGLPLLFAAIIALSGCVVNVSWDDEGSTNETHSTCTQTLNGVTKPCGQSGPGGPRENVSVDERASLQEGIDKAWSFAIHPGANVTLRVALAGHDGNDVGIAQRELCVKLTGGGSSLSHGCGGGNANLVISGNAAFTEPRTLVARDALNVGDYTLSITHDGTLADYHVLIDVHY